MRKGDKGLKVLSLIVILAIIEFYGSGADFEGVAVEDHKDNIIVAGEF